MSGANGQGMGLTIGELSARTGVPVSALRFHEAEGLITPHRSAGNQRRYARADVRRVSFIRIAQGLGLSVAEVRAELARLPQGRTPTAADWRGIGVSLKERLDRQIAELTRTRDLLDGCIGCGCLSLDVCALYNPGDFAAGKGPGPRFILGDRPAQPAAGRGSGP